MKEFSDIEWRKGCIIFFEKCVQWREPCVPMMQQCVLWCSDASGDVSGNGTAQVGKLWWVPHHHSSVCCAKIHRKEVCLAFLFFNPYTDRPCVAKLFCGLFLYAEKTAPKTRLIPAYSTRLELENNAKFGKRPNWENKGSTCSLTWYASN